MQRGPARYTSASMPFREWPVRWWLTSLVAGVALPLAILLTVVLVDQERRERREAHESALRIAKAMSARLRTLHGDSLALLDRMAARPSIRDYDGGPCDSLFAIIDFFPQYLDLALFDEHGHAVCSAVPAPQDAALSRVAQAWTSNAVRAGHLRPREPLIQSMLNHWVGVVAQPVRGRFRGTLVLTTLPEVVGRETFPRGTVMTILDQRGTVVARTDDPEKWTGRNVSTSGIASVVLARGEGQAEEHGLDGVARLYGFTTVPDLNWSVYVGMPTAVVMAPERQALRRLLFGSAAIAVLLITASIIMSRAIGRPIRALVRAAEARAAGGDGKVSVGGPKELATLAQAFNEMFESRSLAERQSFESGQALKALSDRLLVVQEQERTRIAREIHDDLGQALTALKMDVVGILDQSASVSPVLRERVLETLNLLVGAVQRIAAELRPSILDDLGLVAAIESETHSFEERTGIECEVSVGADLPMDSARASAIYRIVQEALTNVARHSNATRVEVRLRTRSGEVLLEVRDDGRGISAQDIGSARSLGLIGIRERAALIGGTVRFEGVPGRGTIVSVRIPLSDVFEAQKA